MAPSHSRHRRRGLVGTRRIHAGIRGLTGDLRGHRRNIRARVRWNGQSAQAPQYCNNCCAHATFCGEEDAIARWRATSHPKHSPVSSDLPPPGRGGWEIDRGTPLVSRTAMGNRAQVPGRQLLSCTVPGGTPLALVRAVVTVPNHGDPAPQAPAFRAGATSVGVNAGGGPAPGRLPRVALGGGHGAALHTHFATSTGRIRESGPAGGGTHVSLVDASDRTRGHRRGARAARASASAVPVPGMIRSRRPVASRRRG